MEICNLHVCSHYWVSPIHAFVGIIKAFANQKLTPRIRIICLNEVIQNIPAKKSSRRRTSIIEINLRRLTIFQFISFHFAQFLHSFAISTLVLKYIYNV